MGYAGVRPYSGATSLTSPAILTPVQGHNHDRAGHKRKAKARPLALLLVVAACGTPPARTEAQADGIPAAADSLDTYVEGSRRVWDAARNRGVTFRAVGQEPGWLLEIERDERMTLLTGYGADTVVVAVQERVVDAAAQATVYRAATPENDVVVTIRDEPCVDSMSGERFSRTVNVVLNGTALSGCGRSLQPAH